MVLPDASQRSDPEDDSHLVSWHGNRTAPMDYASRFGGCMTLDLTRLATLARELREHDAAMTAREWKWSPKLPPDLYLPARALSLTMPSQSDAAGIAYLRNHCRELADLLAAAKGEIERLVDVLARVARHTDVEDPNSYRCDDREGCLDTVHAIAKEAVANPAPEPAKGA
jgi:hypothetical protein